MSSMALSLRPHLADYMQLRLAELGGYIVTVLAQRIPNYILPTNVTYL